MDLGTSEDDSKDYLLDPELWLDKLPQPFQMIDKVLQEFLDEVWELIESRAVVRRQKEARVRIPAVTAGQILRESETAAVIREGPLFLGSASGLSVWEQCSDCDGEWRRVAHRGWGEVPTALTVRESKSVSMVAIRFKQSLRIFAYSKQYLILLTNVSFSNEQDTPPEITQATLSPTWTHVTISTAHPDEGSRLQLYQLPLSSWHSEIETYLRQMEDVEGEGSQSQVSVGSKGSKHPEEVTFSSATQLYSLQPPSLLTPSTAADPASGMQRVVEDTSPGSCLPTGDLHTLSEAYLRNRRRAFVSQRADFVEESRDPLSYANSTPTCHYLFYKGSCKQVDPCQLAVWWEGHNQLFVYPIPDSPPKLHPPPVRLLPQTATIVISAADEEGLHLALALDSGMVSLWNMRTVWCRKLVRVVESSDRVTVMAFSDRGGHLVVGSERGKLLVISTTAQDQTSSSLQHRLSQQKTVYPHLFQHSGYNVESRVVDLNFSPLSLPGVVVSVHASGAVVMWSMTECEALCKISHTRCSSLGRPHSCTLSKKCLFMIGESTVEGDTTVDEDTSAASSTIVLHFDLHTTPTLTPHWSTHSTPSHITVPPAIGSGMTKSIESCLSQYTKSRRAQFKTDKERWQKRWTELPQVLNRLSIASQ